MKINSNIESIIANLKKIASNSEGIDFSEALTVGVNAALGRMKYRIFNTGKDAKQIPFGRYGGKRSRVTNRKFRVKKYGDEDLNRDRKAKRKNIREDAGTDELFTEYEKKRIGSGRQIKYKDLEFHGTLRRGIIVVKESNKRVVAAIPNDKLFKIALGQIEQISRINGVQINIFGLSEEEKEILVDTTNEALKQLYARIFNA